MFKNTEVCSNVGEDRGEKAKVFADFVARPEPVTVITLALMLSLSLSVITQVPVGSVILISRKHLQQTRDFVVGAIINNDKKKGSASRGQVRNRKTRKKKLNGCAASS